MADKVSELAPPVEAIAIADKRGSNKSGKAKSNSKKSNLTILGIIHC
ncbi:hypothetical protein [Mucilaginibacter pedocola]|nr:hypothetical protein [Mucilaginibacter pedocola]